MQKPTFDPGLTQLYTGPLRRAVNQDGSFNVLRQGASRRDIHPYLRLVSTSWPRFFAWILAYYATVNFLFAIVYFLLGPDALQGGSVSTSVADQFLKGLFFSSQTLTTVGFGAIAPRSHMANLVAAIEALIGLLGFAVATGVLLGRVSKPSARIGFSQHAMIAPYQEGTSFQFRIVNRRPNTLMELEATVMLMTVDRVGGALRREYQLLKLERDKVLFFPLMWTIVHPIDESSPLYGKSADDLAAVEAEFMILIKAWDETFGQTVHQRYSYRYGELKWNARFTPGFAIDGNGDMILRVDQVGAHEYFPILG